MVIKIFKCQMCGNRFEVEVFDRDDPGGAPPTGCSSTVPKVR